MQTQKNTALLLFITEEGVNVGGKWYKYNDVLQTRSNRPELYYQSHRSWKCRDNLLQDATMPTYVFKRRGGKGEEQQFMYIGRVVSRSVHIPRSATDILTMKYTIDRSCQDLCSRNKVFAPIPERCSGRFKEGVFRALGVRPVHGNAVNIGIVLVNL